MKKVLLYDCDGVLADTEQFGHLRAFNEMWKEFGTPWHWSAEEYGRKLKIGGGKERLASLVKEASFQATLYGPQHSEEEISALIAAWHKRKSEIFEAIIQSGQIPARPGVKRLTAEALHDGWILGVCSTSQKESVCAVLEHTMGSELGEQFSLVLAGDVVKFKKPASDIYRMAAEKLDVSPSQCVVIEDSRNGLLAAIGAGMRCIITVSSYTRDEDFSEAAIVLTCLGDPGGPRSKVLDNAIGITVSNYFTVKNLNQVLDL